MNRRIGQRWCAVVVLLAAIAGCARREVAPAKLVDVGQPSVNLLALGDAGEDTPEERRVALTMGRLVRRSEERFDAVVMLGDNFYAPLKDTQDPQWRDLFERMYDAKDLALPFYAAMGNHEYLEKNDVIELAYARERPQSRFKMPGRWYRVDLPSAERPLVMLLVCDSNAYDIPPERWAEGLKWMDAELAKAPAGAWKVVCAHHPLLGNSKHGDDKRLIEQWGPLLKKHAVDFYVAGHDHVLEHLEVKDWNTTFLVSGGGGAGLHTIDRWAYGPFARQRNGFLHLRFEPDRAVGRFIASDGTVLHELARTRDGKVEVLKDGGRDNPTPQLESVKD
jgi:diadenosine tetraphosphatase ApaH/serine/threonine PP2A family protein phosphatase